MLPEQHICALRDLSTRLIGMAPTWAVTGSVGLALQGMPVTPHDIDLVTTREGAHEILARCAGACVEPLHPVEVSGQVQWKARLLLCDVEVEVIVADLPPADLRNATLAGMSFKVFSLESEIRSYRLMGRSEKVALIEEWINHTSSGTGGKQILP